MSLPPVPDGWRVTEENNTYTYYTPVLNNGKEYKLTKLNMLTKLIQKDLISEDVRLFFSKSKYIKHKKQEEEVAVDMVEVVEDGFEPDDTPAPKKQRLQIENPVYECSTCSTNVQDIQR